MVINHVYQLVSPHVFSVKYEDVDLTDQVVIKPRYMAICHADQRYFWGKREPKILQEKLPMALIHECCGEVIADAANTFSVGQKVVLIPNVAGDRSPFIYENYARNARFLSSGCDGFMREFVSLAPDRVVAISNVDEKIAAITEFVSVAVHAVKRFMKGAHAIRQTIGIWGDGSLSYTLACVLRNMLPESKLIIVGKNMRKLTQFSFITDTYLLNEIPADLRIDHAFECCGGDGSYFAIEDMIRYINPQGCMVLMGVSENRVAINTRNILEKGLQIIGCSRSGREDFMGAVELMELENFQRRLMAILYEENPACSIHDLYRIFTSDLNTPFKTVFRWMM